MISSMLESQQGRESKWFTTAFSEGPGKYRCGKHASLVLQARLHAADNIRDPIQGHLNKTDCFI